MIWFGKPLARKGPHGRLVRHVSAHRRAAARALGTAVLIALSLSVSVHTGCSKKNEAANKSRPPIFLIGIDGLDWRVMKPLIDKGELPVIEGLMRRGSYGYLLSMQPWYSAVIWTSVATGKSPAKHGILNFVYEDSPEGARGDVSIHDMRETAGSETKRYRSYTSGHRKTKAFWNILSDYDLTVDCIGWWITYPAEPINGIMVSQTNTTETLRNPQAALFKGGLLRGVEDQVYPAERQNRAMELLEEVDDNIDRISEEIFGKRPHPADDFGQQKWDQTEWAFRADATYVRIARDILESRQPFDLFAIYLSSTDVAAHRFWRYAHPEQYANPPDADQIENFGHVIDDAYRYADRAIGELLALAPPDAGIIIVSDHGMHAVNKDRVFRKDDPPSESLSAHHQDAPPGVIIAAGGPFKASSPASGAPFTLDLNTLSPLGSVLDVLPTILAVEGIPVGKDMDGAPMRAVIDFEKLGQKEIRYIPTHDTEEWLASQPKRIREAVDDSERLEQLRALGYIR